MVLTALKYIKIICSLVILTVIVYFSCGGQAYANGLDHSAEDISPLDKKLLVPGSKNDLYALLSERKNTAAPKKKGSLVPKNLYAPNNVQDPAFIEMLRKRFPLSPEQIKALRHVLDNQFRAVQTPVEVPRPLVSSKWVNLSPGSIPPVIRLASGYVSSIVFVDETGEPWPISAYDIGNPTAFNIQWDKNNILMIQSLSAYANGNMVVQLLNLKTPIVITITSDQKKVDYRLDMRVPGRGPNAKASLIGSKIITRPSELLANLLEGVAPKGSRPLHVEGGNAQAWICECAEGYMYLRTKLVVLSPSWHAYMRSADGMQAYRMDKTPLILASDKGKTVQLRIKGL